MSPQRPQPPPPSSLSQQVLYEEAGTNHRTFQGGLRRDCDARGQLLPSRRAANGRGMRLADFVAHESARAANLTEVHVAALRLYSTDAFRAINAPLRDQERFGRHEPHPLPLTVAWIRDALSKLRKIEAQSARKNELVVLYRGMKGLQIQPEFLSEGGTELAPMSTTASLKVAMQYSASEKALLLRIRTKNFMVRGPTISFLSAFPDEDEFLFPPLTCAPRKQVSNHRPLQQPAPPTRARAPERAHACHRRPAADGPAAGAACR